MILPIVLITIIAVSSIGSLLWGTTSWGSGVYIVVQFLLPLIWATSAIALLMSWGPKKRWVSRSIVAVSAVPALYYPGEMIAMSLFFAIRGFV